MKITSEIKQRILNLVHHKSVQEVATDIGCSRATVDRVVRAHGVVRTREEKTAIRSRVRTEQVRSERRRSIFGLSQVTGLKVFSNKERISFRYLLKRKGYRFLCRGDTIAFYDDSTERDESYEERGRKLGLVFQPLSSIQIQNQ